MNKILVVDESELFLLIVKSLFDRSGCEVLMAKNAQDAFRLIGDEKPQLILINQSLPDMFGYSVCKKIKNIEGTKNIVVVMITASNKRSDIDMCLNAGCDDYITPPVHKETLLDSVSKYIEILKRADERVPIYEGVKYYYEGVEYSGHLHMISKGGAFIMGERMLPHNSEISLKFHVSKVDESIEATGKVVWNLDSLEQLPHLLTTAQGMGIKFVEISDDARSAILKYVSLASSLIK